MGGKAPIWEFKFRSEIVMNRLLASTIRMARSFTPLSLLGASAFLLPGQTLQITSPANGAVFSPGQTIPVTISAAPSAFRTVAVAGDLPIRPSRPLTAPPYEFRMPTPADIPPGPYELRAICQPWAGNTVHAAPVTVAIERPDSPRQLKPDLNTLFFDYIGDGVNMVVYGVFADGSTVDLTRSTLTTWASDNPSVATVDVQGTVTAVGPGSAKIIVANRNATAVVTVTVPRARKR
jgi:hypothetical protein